MAPGGMKKKRTTIPREGIRNELRGMESSDLLKNRSQVKRMTIQGTNTTLNSTGGRDNLGQQGSSTTLNSTRNQQGTTTTLNSTRGPDDLDIDLSTELPRDDTPEITSTEDVIETPAVGSTPEITSTEDVIETPAVGSKRRRGETLGKGIMKYFADTGNKIKINVDKDVGRPLDVVESAKLASQIGVVTRDVLSVPKRWKEVDKKDGLEPGFDHLKIHMDINVDDPGVKEALVDKMKISSRNKRHLLHKHFKNYATLEEAKLNKPKLGCPSQVKWEELCDYFASDKYKRICAVNKENRSKLRCKHISGRKAFTVRSHEISKKELNGQKCDRIELYARTHSTDKDGWKSDEARENWEKMLKKKEEYAEQGIDKSSDEIVFEVLGHGTGYIKGLGYGPKPPTKQRELLETKEKLAESEAEVAELRTEMGDVKDKLNKLMNFLAVEKGMNLDFLAEEEINL